MGSGFGTGWWMWALLAGLAGFWALIILVVRSVSRDSDEPRALTTNPLTELEQRLACGEISIKEYTRLRRAITEGH